MLGVAVLAVLLVFGIPWVEEMLNTVSTDDAFVNGYVTFVAPRVAGQISRVLVDDNNRVHKGDLLVELDQEPFRDAVAVKKAAVDTAQADLQAANATAQLNERQQETQYLQTQNTIVLNVRQAFITLEQDRAAIAAAEEARIYAQQSYDDEVKKLQLGTSTAFTVVQKQQLLTTAQGVELRDRINLIEAELNFNQAMGRTLEVNNITLADALKGGISHTPNIPGTPDADQRAGH